MQRKGGVRVVKMTLAAARVNRGLTQAELAEKIGVSRQAIFDWENGKRNIRPVNLFAICSALNVTEDDILLPQTITDSNN